MANIIGDNIRILREKMEFNQKSVARFLDVDQSLISKVEKGERNLSADMLEKLACLYGVTIESIMGGRIESSKLAIAFRANDLTTEDMETLSAINRIALNSEFMANLLEGENV